MAARGGGLDSLRSPRAHERHILGLVTYVARCAQERFLGAPEWGAQVRQSLTSLVVCCCGLGLAPISVVDREPLGSRNVLDFMVGGCCGLN